MKKIFLFTTLLTSITNQAADLRDPLFEKQWALKNNGQVILKNISELERIPLKGIPGSDINWIETSGQEAAKNELLVAVLDSGLDVDHPDLKDKVTALRWNFLDGNLNVADDMGHGTHVAGVIAANKNNLGIVGAADPRIKIMPLKVLSSQVSGFVYNGKLLTDVIADAMVFAIKNGAQVINLSLGWPKLIDTAKVRNAFLMAEQQNVLVIAASGNNSKDLPTFPCAYESVICVGALDNRGQLTDFTNHGSKVDVVAPGEYIVSTFPRNLESRVLRIKNYEVKRGSSQAAPYVTAAMATLKLFHPELTNDQSRSLLFQSSKLLTNDQKRFVKFGALDMKSLINTSSTTDLNSFVIPLVKGITEVKFKKIDRRFSFKLPIKNISSNIFNGEVCLTLNSLDINLDNNCFILSQLKSGELNSLQVSGTLNKLDRDSHQLIEINIAGKKYSSTIVFSRDLNVDSELNSNLVSGANFDEMAIISGERKLSKMARVLDKFRRLDFPEYSFLEKTKQTDTQTNISLLTNDNGQFKIKSIIIPKVNRVLSIHRQDINQDGELDYFIYALSANKDQLLFINLNKNLEPLFKNLSTWSMPLTTFEGLPIDGGQEKFDWITLNHPTLGKILTPAFMKSYDLPEADNSKNILDRVIGKTPRIFFLNPTVDKDKVTIEQRVLDSVGVMKKLRSELGILSDSQLSLVKTIPQNSQQSKTGLINALMSTMTDQGLKYFQVSFSDKLFKATSLSTNFSISDSLIYPILNSNDFILTSLLNRSSAEFLLLKNSEVTSESVIKKEWENPVIGMIGAFNQNNANTLLIENRSTVTLVRPGLDVIDLPVYRDSSFPGQSFSETLMPIMSEGRPGVYVNSTLIFGERLYTMVATEQDFIRALNLSVNIPEGCVPLAPETLLDRNNFNYTLLCRDPSKGVNLKFLPMLVN